MGVVTKYRLAEECLRIITGGNPAVGSKVHINELKIAVAQLCNKLLKVDYLQTNLPMMEMIPNGSVLGLYENILVTSISGKAICTLPIKPIKLPRNIGVFSLFDEQCEYIPLEMGQANLLQSQPLLNNLLGQTGYEVFGDRVIFTTDITIGDDNPKYVSARLLILDANQYSDYDPLPILPEMEWDIKKEVVATYLGEPVADKLVNANKEQKQPIQTQSQT